MTDLRSDPSTVQPTDRRTDRRTERLVELAEADPQRPRFHFASPGGWLNDPNGVGQWQGRYHLFYQYNPYAAVHGRIHWGHASSEDLVTWTDEPVALVPGDDGPDRDGCWSGVLVDDDGIPTLVYSGNRDGRQLPCVAVGSADLRSWTVDAGNPVIPGPPTGVTVTGFRDHCVWRENGHWRQLVGSGITGVGGTAFVYDSDDLREWRLVGSLLVGDGNDRDRGDAYWTGLMWECVDLFRPPTRQPGVAASDVLVFSACDDVALHHALYFTGTYSGDGFSPSALERLDLGGLCFYAPQSFQDASGRRVMFGWLQEERPMEASVAAGWSGVMSLPRELTLGPDGLLWQEPVAEVASLRSNPFEVPAQTLDEGVVVPLGSDVELDAELTLRLEPGAVLELAVRETSDGAERTVIRLARGQGADTDDASLVRLDLDRSHSSLDPALDAVDRSGAVPVGEDGLVALRVIVDHSALEVFANGRALAARLYPTRPDAVGLSLVMVRGVAALDASTSWAMRDSRAGARQLWPVAP